MHHYPDTWDWDSYLISWIPPEFTQLVQNGIDVNPEGCILWAETVDSPFTKQLRNLGFIE
jgi:hypothetical protein